MKNIPASTLLLLIISLQIAGKDIAYREDVETPHWQWEGKNFCGTVKALFITPSLAVREPVELAQRFDVETQVMGVSGQPPNGLSLDQEKLGELLKKDYDAYVIACYYAKDIWERMSPENRDAILTKTRNGAALVIFMGWGKWISSAGFISEGKASGSPDSELDDPESPKIEPVIEEAAAVARALPVSADTEKPAAGGAGRLVYRGGLSTATLPFGKGKIVYYYGTAGHFTSFNVFLGEDVNFPMHSNPGAFFDDPVSPELFYAVASRWLRRAAGKESQVLVTKTVAPDKPAPLEQKTAVKLLISGKTASGDRLKWFLYSTFGDRIDKGESDLSSEQKEVMIEMIPRQAGQLTCRWCLERDGRTLDYGASVFSVESPAKLELARPENPLDVAKGLPLSWKIAGVPAEDDIAVFQVYDPDGRLMAEGSFPAKNGEGGLSPWIASGVSHKLRVLMLRGGLILDEQRIPFQALIDRSNDSKDYVANVWGFEGGMGTWQGRYRCRLLRELGITSISGTGGEAFCRMAGEEGLRVVLCNIFHPNNRKNPKYSAAQAEEKLEETAKIAGRFSPVGYMLGDEPGDLEDVVQYTENAAAIIRRQDSPAKVGWSGVWMSFKQDAPEFFKACNYVTAYSPHHLYTPDLWLGVERDLYRSFANPEGILTCWTHYAPWADNEAYSRTVPWLWLFEGMNGVSYFSSAGEFAVLSEDLRTTHETRWWSEEVKELRRGIGKQLIAMNRDTGAIRILFSRNASGSEIWMRALNRLNIPYSLVSREELLAGLDGRVKLLICPAPFDMTDSELDRLTAFVNRGNMLVVTCPAGMTADGKIAPPGRLVKLFGIERSYVPATEDEMKKDMQIYGGLNSEIKLRLSSKDEYEMVLTGISTGEHGLRCAGARTAGSFEKIGGFKKGDGLKDLQFLQKIFDTPAATVMENGKGQALYLAFQPDLESTKKLIPALMAQAGIPTPAMKVTLDGKLDDTVYLYPFASGSMRMLGVVQDYWRVQPEWDVLADGEPAESAGSKETVLYYNHGPQIWGEREAVLHLGGMAHLYDSRRGAYLGFASEAKFKLQAGRPELFAVLPYKIGSLSVEAPAEAGQGDKLTLSLNLRAEDATPGMHVVHVSLTDPAGKQAPSDRFNIALEKGKSELDFQIPFNATPGEWRIDARDTVTGTEAAAKLLVKDGDAPGWPALAFAEPEIRRTALDWPEGRLISHAERTAEEKRNKEQAVQVKGAELKQIALPRHWDKYANQKGLTASFTLSNKDASYQMKYEVCCDAKANGWDDPRRIWTPYRPGLGVQRPNPMAWYYNGYLEVWLDDFCAADFAMSKLEQIKDGNNGRVDATFDTPRGILILSFAMMPDHIGLFQQLEIKPSAPVKKVRLAFRRYDWGGEGRPNSFIEIDPEEKSWAITGDRLEDRAFGKGAGPAAMMIIPGQWDKVVFTPPSPTLEKTVDIPAGGSFKAQWVLWLFPDFSNEKARNYMRDNSKETEKRLGKIFGR